MRFGAFVAVGGFTSLPIHQVALDMLAFMLGLFILGQGVLLVRHPERRHSNRCRAKK